MVKLQRETYFRASVSRAVWSKTEKKNLVREINRLKKKLGRPLRANDLKKTSIPKRTFSAIKSQAARMHLFKPTRKIQIWNSREKHILILLGGKRKLGARTIKSRGFFTETSGTRKGWKERTVDSIAQKKRREGCVDPMRSLRAKLARHLSKSEKAKLKRELKTNSKKWTTEEFALKYGLAPSTIRSYRKRWRIKHSWKIAMSLPGAQSRQKRLAEETRIRNIFLWKQRKEKLLQKLLKTKERLVQKKSGGKRKIKWRTCTKCGIEWPANQKFFARSPKVRDGELVAIYLRRSCRVCPRRGNPGSVNPG